MNVAVKPAKHAAPGQYLGFALQPVRLCFHLLTCERGAAVSIELLDDIAIHHSDGRVTLEQTKSATKQNPISDFANDLWKTVANWLDAVSTGAVEAASTAFQLYVTPPKSGSVVLSLSDAKTTKDVAAVVAAVEAKLAKLDTKPGCASYLDQFLAAPEGDRAAVVSGLTLISEDEDPVDPIRGLLKATVPPTHIDRLCEAAIGMAKERADRLIRGGHPPIVDGDAFKTSFRAFVQKNVLSNYLPALSDKPPAEEVDAILSLRPMFLKQLELVAVSDDERVRAVSDFLRSSADKSRWADAGMIFEGSLTDWDDDLVKRHGLTAGEIADLHGDKEAAIRGRLVYRRCAQMEAPLEGRAVPAHFVHGCFNALADSRRLGWHPDHKTLLADEG